MYVRSSAVENDTRQSIVILKRENCPLITATALLVAALLIGVFAYLGATKQLPNALSGMGEAGAITTIALSSLLLLALIVRCARQARKQQEATERSTRTASAATPPIDLTQEHTKELHRMTEMTFNVVHVYYNAQPYRLLWRDKTGFHVSEHATENDALAARPTIGFKYIRNFLGVGEPSNNALFDLHKSIIAAMNLPSVDAGCYSACEMYINHSNRFYLIIRHKPYPNQANYAHPSFHFEIFEYNTKKDRDEAIPVLTGAPLNYRNFDS